MSHAALMADRDSQQSSMANIRGAHYVHKQHSGTMLNILPCYLWHSSVLYSTERIMPEHVTEASDDTAENATNMPGKRDNHYRDNCQYKVPNGNRV